MSLLLDALKKAAEQKAQKSKSQTPPERPTDETLLDLGADAAAPVRADEGQASREDETDFDHSELSARLERGSVVSGAVDETGLDLPDTTETRLGRGQPVHRGEDTGLDLPEATQTRLGEAPPPHGSGDETAMEIPAADDLDSESLSEQLQTGEDESIVFESEDVSNFVVEYEPVELEEVASEDETDLSQLGEREDMTGTGDQDGGREPAAAEDETDLSQAGAHEDPGATAESVDDEIVIADRAGEDETDLSQPAQRSEQTDHQAAAGEDDTSLSQPRTSAAQFEAAQAQSRPDSDEAAKHDAAEESVVSDEDLSLLLLEPDPTNPGAAADTSVTDQQASIDRQRSIDAADELALEDTTQSRSGSQTDTQAQTVTNPTATAIYTDDTRVAQDTRVNPETATRDKATRADSTSTRTYAPDNYDRTLMKLPSDDASKLFAGMKSDSDVVMTPDYAKKVFLSKTSAQRVQHYKFYLGITIVILLSIGIVGVFQYQEESLQIDDSLRALKRDPMPGVIKTPQPQETNLFAGSDSQATARTIEIIETADSSEPDSGTSEAAQSSAGAEAEAASQQQAGSDETQVEQSESSVATSTTTQAGSADAEQVSSASQLQAASQAQVSASESAQIASLAAAQQSSAQTPAEPASNLQIRSSSQYRQVDLWLREAYAAYRAGENQQALRLYNNVLEVDPGNRNALLARAAINMQDGNIDAAIRDYQALLLANPKDSLAMSSLLAVASYSPQETETQLKLMLRDEPESPYLNFALANTYGAQNRWQDAQRHYFKALQTRPHDPNYAYNLAVSLEHISQPASAVTYYQRALDNFENGLATFNREIVNQRLQMLGTL